MKVADSIPNEVIEFFDRPNPSSLNVARRPTEPLTGAAICERTLYRHVGTWTSDNLKGLHGLLQGELCRPYDLCNSRGFLTMYV
jgi:hypothetical protein